MTMNAHQQREHAFKQSAMQTPHRDRLPTLPEDLSEYAWLHTGPESWSAQQRALPVLSDDVDEDDADGDDDCIELSVTDLEVLSDPADDDQNDDDYEDADPFVMASYAEAIEPDELDRHISSGIDEITAGLLIDLWHSDVPQLVVERTAVVDERELHVVSLMDGTRTVGAVLETSGLPVTDVLGVFCELCARGVVTLDRSRRIAPK